MGLYEETEDRSQGREKEERILNLGIDWGGRPDDGEK